MKRLEKSALPSSIPTGGMRRSLTKQATTLPKAAPMTTPTASSTTLPRMMNSLNSFSMVPCPPGELVGLSPEECGDIEVFFGRLCVALGADVGRHAAAPLLRGGQAGASRALQVHDLARGLARLLALAEARRDHGDPHLVLQARVDDGAEDDMRLFVRRLLDDAGGRSHLLRRPG